LGLLILIQLSVSMNVVVQFLHAMMTPLTD
jgi:hypothetical protein